MKYVVLTVCIVLSTVLTVRAQETFPVNGVQDNRANAVAFTNATIITSGDTKIENATMLIRDGKIEAIGTNVKVPAGYVVEDVKGNYIYPALIDLSSNYGLPKPDRNRRGRFGGPEQIQSDTEGAYNANEAIKAEYNASDEFTISSRDAESWRKMGFGAVLSQRFDGLARGTSAFVTLGGTSDNEVMLNTRAAAHYSFDKGSSSQDYPSSAMGYIAVLRQTYMDAAWYNQFSLKPFTDKTLNSWISNQSLPQIFTTSGWMTALRADKVGDEFGVQYILQGGGDEYQRLAEVKKTGARMIIPINFPDAYDVDDPFDAQRVSLEDMKHWELAPANPAMLEKNGISFAITSQGSNSNFWANLRKAVKHGLSKETALNALTITPAGFVGMQSQVGSLQKGKLANFIIASGDIFEDGTEIYENWIQGMEYVIKSMDTPDKSGSYELSMDGTTFNLEISGQPGKHSAKISGNDSSSISVNMKLDGNLISMNFKPEKGSDAVIRMSGWTSDNGFKGQAINPQGEWVSWTATKTGDAGSNGSGNRNNAEGMPDLGKVIYPFSAYGSEEIPQQETILIKNATVWTNEEAGVLEGTDVLLKDGKIDKIGKGLSERGVDRIIDGTGKHVTAGVVDEHSHLAASSINDVAVNSGMVRIGDVINSEDIGVYRALAGGVTALQILHGSANPIGGQSALIKLRWGKTPEELKVIDADGFIKFALGENVKRSRSNNSIRFPQTRMGVEQVFVDAFTEALEYEKEWKAYNALSTKAKANATKPRRDLATETMLEIIKGERFISCHSYVQSEINMLMKVAEQFGFRINTFTHILEGYKVADIMAEHGVGGSTFSDWWNYKWEVRYAIPYNAAIMHRQGVVTAINSDSDEMIRRLNQEAAKSIKYGDLTEEEALKLVTLNPSKLLHLDDRMGSIKEGKDGDVVVWNNHPLSIYAKPEQTIIDGTVYFDLKKDQEHREYIKKEKARLIEKMKGVKKSGGRFSRRSSSERIEFHCEDILGVEADRVHQH